MLDSSTDGRARQRRHGITHLFVLLNPRPTGNVGVRKGLDAGRFARGKGSVLLVMEVSYPMWSALGQDGGREAVRIDPTVTLRVVTAPRLV